MRSEGDHFDTLVSQIWNIGGDVDEFVFKQIGVFVNEEIQALYHSLLEAGSQSSADALEVGLAIEKKDMIDIPRAAEAVEGIALAQVYDKLLTGSGCHLAAFEAALEL